MANSQQSGRNEIQIAVMASEMKQMKDDIAEIKSVINKFIDGMNNNYVTQQEFGPYRRVVQLIGAVVVTGIAALLFDLITK